MHPTKTCNGQTADVDVIAPRKARHILRGESPRWESFYAKASTTEEPDARKPHVRGCAGALGNWPSYRERRPLLKLSLRAYAMLIDEFLPRYDVEAQYQIDVHASLSEAYSAARSLDMCNSKIVRWLYRLRGLPRRDFTIDGMLKWGFVLLADNPSKELVFGLIGRFWTPTPKIQRINAEAFTAFNKPGFAKAVGNIAGSVQSFSHF